MSQAVTLPTACDTKPKGGDLKADLIVISYNSREHLEKMLPSLYETTDMRKCTLTIVDNGSKRDTLKFLREQAQERGFALIENKKNLGYGAACNIGAKATSSPVIIFLNADLIFTKGWLEPLVQGLDRPYTAIVGPQLTTEHQILYPGRENWVCGAVFCVRREIFFELGGFDEYYKFGWEETDLCRKAILSGYGVYQIRDSRVVHEGGESLKDTPFWKRHFSRGERHFKKKYDSKNGRKRVIVCIPSFKFINPHFFITFLNLVVRLSKASQGEKARYEFYFATIFGHQVDDARNRAVGIALANDADYILFIDDDMTVEADLFDRLVAHKKPIVGALCFRRGVPYDPMIFEIIPDPVETNKRNFVSVSDWKPGLQRVDGCGFGAVLIKTSVFKKLPKPWFQTSPGLGEDIYFAAKCKDNNIPVYVDADTEVGHVGDLIINSTTCRDYRQRKGMIENG